MRFNIDSGKLLYALGVLFGAAALLYFVRDVVFDLSITVKTALLGLAFIGFFVGGLSLQRDVLDVVALAFAGVTYVIFVGYVVVRYAPGETGTFLLLALSAGLFVALGYIVRGRVTVSRRRAGAVIGAILVVSTVLVGVDAVSGSVTYTLETQDTVTVDPVATEAHYGDRQKRIGTVTASNPSVFTRPLSLPAVDGCLAGVGDVPNERVWVDYESGYSRPDTIAGGTTERVAVQASIPVDSNQTEALTYTIERETGCSADRASPTLLVEIDGESR